jgi:hypothetical protein
MKFDLKKPCANCPFRNDRPDQEGWLGEERAADIIDAITRLQGTFSCHKTNGHDDEGEAIVNENSQHCAGALIMLEHNQEPNQMMRIMERLGFYDRTKLDMDAPVFKSYDEFVRFMS